MYMARSTTFLTRLMLFLHRILGTALCLLFAVWFLSGLVMIYHTFPRVTQAERIARQDGLEPDSLPSLASLLRRQGLDEPLRGLSLNRDLGRTMFHVRTDASRLDLPACPADTMQPSVAGQIALRVGRWCNAPLARVDTLHDLDQWIPFSRLRADLPVYKFRFDDPEGHELYVSSRTGDVIQFTTRSERFWAWLGPIPHWVYFTSLRQNQQLWTRVVILLSGIGCLMCVAGLYLGVRDFLLARRRGSLSPFRKRSFRWHHLAGMVFGLFVLTFCFSGMMSLVRPADVGIHSRIGFDPMRRLDSLAVAPEACPLDYRKALRSARDSVRQMEWGSFGDIPFYTLHTDGGTLTVDARHRDTVRALSLSHADVAHVLSRVHPGQDVSIELLNSYDNYYLGRSGHLTLPVWKAEVDDADHSCYYINPRTGRVRYVNTPSRWMHWMYPALHSLRLRLLVDQPVLWHVCMWVLMLGGTCVSLTGVWLGVNYVRRKFRCRNSLRE